MKGLAYEAADALERDFRPQLMALNPRAEAPVLTDGTLTIVNSSDILRYLEERYPEPRLFPAKIEDRVVARALERLADQRLDPIVVDCSFWGWAERPDQPPPGLREAGQADLESVFETLEDTLADRPQPWPFEAPGVVECAWFPNLVAVRPMGFRLDEARFPHVAGWLAAYARHHTPSSVRAHDRQRTAAFLKALASSNHERAKLFWSGDRLEWLLSRGFHDWFLGEIAAGRASFPPYAPAVAQRCARRRAHDVTQDDGLQDFEHRQITLDGVTKLVHVAGAGPAVIVMTAMPGISPHVARFARWVRDAGFTVYMPSLFGRDGAVPGRRRARRSSSARPVSAPNSAPSAPTPPARSRPGCARWRSRPTKPAADRASAPSACASPAISPSA